MSVLITNKSSSGSSAVSINALYENSAGTTLPAGTAVPFPTQVYDTNSAFVGSTGIYTVPTTGKYTVSCNVQSNTFVPSVSNQYGIDLAKNGTTRTLRIAYFDTQAAISQTINLNGSATINCTAGDTLRVIGVNAGGFVLMSDATVNWISIVYIGT